MFMMRIPDNDRSNSSMDISSILELTGLVFSPGKSKKLFFFKRTCTSLQSLMNFLVYAFYFVLFDLHDYKLHTQDAFFGIPSDTRAQDNYHANAYYEPAGRSDTLNF